MQSACITTDVIIYTKNDPLTTSQYKRLSVLSDLEEFAFYDFPDFDDQLIACFWLSHHIWLRRLQIKGFKA